MAEMRKYYFDFWVNGKKVTLCHGSWIVAHDEIHRRYPKSIITETPPNKSVYTDAGDSAASSGIVHASALSTSQAESAQSQRG